MSLTGIPIEALDVCAYTVPTTEPESGGTFAWDSTTMVLVEARGCGEIGVGYTYTDRSAAALIRQMLEEVVAGADALDIPARWDEMVGRLSNVGRSGLASSAIAAVDNALWDLKARVVGLPLCRPSGWPDRRFRSTAAEDSPPMTSTGWSNSCRVGWPRDSNW